ncbi:potassium channel family protein [Vulcanisaeta thermophila]|uniref:potassium channel family protein n=1 Tax=Vulcanisaeta thermophila TaxID=867917 RepID=UPI000853CAB9|nr:NAD-binding protein [Vulcanisaeta thermophila]
MKNVIVVGANDLGIEVSKELIALGYEVTIVDQSNELCSKAYKILKSSASIYRGDPTNPDVLTEVGIDKAEVLLALLDSDDDNYKVCSIGRERGVPIIMAKVSSRDKEDLFKELNVKVINTSAVLATQIVNAVTQSFKFYEDPDNNIKFAIINVPSESPLLGKRISEVVSDYDVAIPYVITGGKPTKVSEDTVIEGGAVLVVVGEPERVDALIRSIIG